MQASPILWEPDAARASASRMADFMRRHGFDDYAALYRWSVESIPEFWEAIGDYFEVDFSTPCI